MTTNTKCLYAVNTQSHYPVKTLLVVYESPSMYLLENKALVPKQKMGDSHHLYFQEKAIAETVCSYLKMTTYKNDAVTNLQAIQNCTNASSLALLLFDMIQILCEEGMPTHRDIEDWLNSPSAEDKTNPSDVDTYDLEEYDILKEGDTVYYIDNSIVLPGKIAGVRRTLQGRIKNLSVSTANDFIGISGTMLGKILFINRQLAEFFATPI